MTARDNSEKPPPADHAAERLREFEQKRGLYSTKDDSATPTAEPASLDETPTSGATPNSGATVEGSAARPEPERNTK